MYFIETLKSSSFPFIDRKFRKNFKQSKAPNLNKRKRNKRERERERERERDRETERENKRFLNIGSHSAGE